MGNPVPAPTCRAQHRCRGNSQRHATPAAAGRPAAAQPQFAGTDNPPTEAASPRPAKPPKSARPPRPCPSAPCRAAARRTRGRTRYVGCGCGCGGECIAHRRTHKGPSTVLHHRNARPPRHSEVILSEAVRAMPPDDADKSPPGALSWMSRRKTHPEAHSGFPKVPMSTTSTNRRTGRSEAL